MYNKYKINKLSNKLEYVTIPDKNIKYFSLYVFIRAGSRDETKKNRGSSHLLEHMLFKGTKKRPSYKIINNEFDTLGGSFNAFTSKNITGYYINAPSIYLEKSLELLSDLLFNSKISEKDIIKEKQVVIEELSKSIDNSERWSLVNSIKMALEGHPLEHLIIGTKENIENFLRKDIYEYYKKHYNPSNMFISICGNFNNIDNLIKKYFTINTKIKYSNPIPNVPLKNQKIPKINVILKKNTNQVSISITFPTCNMYDIKNKFLVKTIAMVLGGGVSSRLYEEIRGKQALAYGINVDCEFYQDTGIFFITTGIDKDSLFENKKLNNKNGGLFVLLNEIKKIKNKGITKKELKKIKNKIISQFILKQTPSFIAEHYGIQLTYKQPNILNLDETENIYKNIKLKDVNNMCYKLFDFTKMNICIIGDYKEKNIVDYLTKTFI